MYVLTYGLVEMVGGIARSMITTWLGRGHLVRAAEGLAVAVAVSLPWSTSATGILIAIWLLALLPTLDVASLRRVLASPAGAMPVALWGLGIVGTLWSDAAWVEKVEALSGHHKLLAIPLLLVQFSRSDKGTVVLGAFLASCTVLLAASWLFWFWPLISRPGIPAFIPVKDYGVQSGEFLLCGFALAHWAIDAWRQQQRALAVALSGLTLAFLANITFVVTSRSTLLTFAALVIFFGFQRFRWRGMLVIMVGAAIFAASSWAFSPYLRARVFNVFDELALYRTDNTVTSTSARLEFWKKSIEFIAAAPVIGHGTGSIRGLFRNASDGTTGVSGAVTDNPHNLTLQIAIQYGVLGVIVLYALWAAHLHLFRGVGPPSWIGVAVVVQDIIGSIFLSHLFSFSTGWIYVFGVGVLGGWVLRGGRPEVQKPL